MDPPLHSQLERHHPLVTPNICDKIIVKSTFHSFTAQFINYNSQPINKKMENNKNKGKKERKGRFREASDWWSGLTLWFEVPSFSDEKKSKM